MKQKNLHLVLGLSLMNCAAFAQSQSDRHGQALGVQLWGETIQSLSEIPHQFSTERHNYVNAIMNCARKIIEERRVDSKLKMSPNEAVIQTAAAFLKSARDDYDSISKLYDDKNRCEEKVNFMKQVSITKGDLMAGLVSLKSPQAKAAGLAQPNITRVLKNFVNPIETCHAVSNDETVAGLIAFGAAAEVQFCQVTNGTQYFRIGGQVGVGAGIGGASTFSIRKTERAMNVYNPSRTVDVDNSGHSTTKALVLASKTKDVDCTRTDIKNGECRLVKERGIGVGVGLVALKEIKGDIPVIPAGNLDKYLINSLMQE